MISNRLPAPMLDVIRGLAQTAHSLQEFRDKLMTAPMPQGMAQYLERTMEKSAIGTVPSPDAVVEMLTREMAQSILWAILYVVIWMVLSAMIRRFIGMLFISGDGKTIIGVFDGFLGMAVMTFIFVASMIVFSGAIFPVMLMTGSESNISWMYPWLLDSKLFSWMASIYQSNVISWLG